MTRVIGMVRILMLTLAVATMAASSVSAAQLARGVSVNCSQSHQGTLLYSECYSTIAYMDPKSSEVFYCHGDHQVVTHGAIVERFVAKAECVLAFRPFDLAGEYVLLDVTKGLLPNTSASEANLFPDAVAWTISTTTRDLQYCSSFTAGLAGLQRRCASATFR